MLISRASRGAIRHAPTTPTAMVTTERPAKVTRHSCRKWKIEMKRAHFALAALLACCSSKHLSLVATTADPSGSHCAEGGVAIASGTDTNDNGKLDTNEV